MRTTIQLAKAIISEIQKDKTLFRCKTFSELHNHCDANTLGGVEEKEFKLVGKKEWPIFTDRLNEAQNMVNFYLMLGPDDRIIWLNQIENQYFNNALIERVGHLVAYKKTIFLASEIADLNLVIHDLRSELLKHGLMKELEKGGEKSGK